MIIITGSRGFIGKNFIKKLINEKIIEIDTHNCWDFIKNFNQWEKVSMIIHQGAISSTTEKDVKKLYEHNVNYSIMLMEKAIKYSIPIKYASSASVYGNEKKFNPLNQYALSKLQVDYWVEDHIDLFSHIQGFRYFNVYGQGEDAKGDQASPVSKFIKQINETGRLKLFKGSENFFRDFIYVGDVVDIVLNNKNDSGIFDLGTSLPVSFQHVAECVSSKYGGSIEIIDFPNHLYNKYQFMTRAKEEWPSHKFISVKEYLT
jgi:ADP-L-glycero-D-manno-heptose 6-epimerase